MNHLIPPEAAMAFAEVIVRGIGREILLDQHVDSGALTDLVGRALRLLEAQGNITPEISLAYRCPACENRTAFVGIDHHGFPGFHRSVAPHDEGCEYGIDDNSMCDCIGTLRQPFTVDERGEVDHHLFTVDGDNTGDDAQIGDYDEIRCAACDTLVWCEAGRSVGIGLGWRP